MINFQPLRTAIIEALGDLLGYYQVGKFKIPACVIDGDGRFQPQGQAFGLEVVIVPALASPIEPMLRANRWNYESEIHLKQWGVGDLLEATERIVPLLGNQVEVGPRVLPLAELGNIETRTIRFTNSEVKRWVPI